MSKKRFSEQEQEYLMGNRYVVRVSEKAITYADEFKQLFIDQYILGKSPREIFEACGFEIDVLGIKRVEQCADRWKKAYERDGIVGLADSRKETSGRPLLRELSQEETIAKQEARIKLLESQLELLKKLDTKERLLVAKGMNLSKVKLFELIKDAVDQGLGRMTGYLCSLLNVSRSGYYSYIHAADSRLKRALSDAKAGDLIKKAFQRRGYKKGSRSIKMILENEFGVIYNLKKIRKLLMNYRCHYLHKSFPAKQSKHPLHIRQFCFMRIGFRASTL